MQQINYSAGSFGGYRLADTKHPMTGYYLSQSEYDAIIRKMNSTAYDLTVAQQNNERQLSELNIKNAKKLEEHKQAIHQLEDQIKQLSEDLALEKDLNKNLIRISKERANADRKLRPKKNHSGYVLLCSQQKVRKIRQGRELIDDFYWEARIQTPYSVELTAKNTEEIIKADNPFIELLGHHVLQELFLRANCQVGYWECIINYKAESANN